MVDEADLDTLVLAYRDRTMPLMEKARRFTSFRVRHRVSQQALARLTGITPGTIHHYESLLTLAPALIEAVESGRLKFKEARALADLRNGRGPDHARQLDIAQAFLSGFLSSVYVESMVRIAKASPEASKETVLDWTLAEIKVQHPKMKLPERPSSPLRPNIPTPSEIKQRVIDLAAMLTPLRDYPLCEIETMRIRQLTRILWTRMQEAGLAPS